MGAESRVTLDPNRVITRAVVRVSAVTIGRAAANLSTTPGSHWSMVPVKCCNSTNEALPSSAQSMLCVSHAAAYFDVLCESGP